MGIRWSLPAFSGSGKATSESILDAVAEYIPRTHQILIIELPDGHKRIEKELKKYTQ